MTSDEQDTYVLATLEGPFGQITQMSAAMRLSEAAMTAYGITKRWPKELVSDVRLVQQRENVVPFRKG